MLNLRIITHKKLLARKTTMRNITVPAQEQFAVLSQNVEEIIGKEELLQKLKDSYDSDTPLRIKLGADPSRPDLHIGHGVALQKMKQFQDFGHTILFVIGDFTALIGDPSGKNSLRPMLSPEQVTANAETYKAQVSKVLDTRKMEVLYNSTWLGKLSSYEMIKILAAHTVQQLLARDDFSKRYSRETPIFMHELVYPVMQAYDSYAIRADIEFGGTDQKFNLLLGREVQRHFKQKAQNIILMPLIEGLDGVQKMSKSLDNYIGFTDQPEDMFGKIMSISDTMMRKYIQFLGVFSNEQRDQLLTQLDSASIHPMEAKKILGEATVKTYWDEDKSIQARKHFENVFSKKQLPDELNEIQVTLQANGCIDILEISIQAGFSTSRSEARRVLKQNGMKLDNITVEQEKPSIPSDTTTLIFRQGKRKMVRLLLM
ncbi:MAG: tyrosine--tRNA ligase [Zetaproteobacteria bacterium]|nr:tyrosine--tRNA ligase [Zetaproteobacteria bacterium]